MNKLFDDLLDPESLEEVAARSVARAEGRRDRWVIWSVGAFWLATIIASAVFGK